MRHQAKSSILVKGKDSIAFSIRRRKKVAHIVYHYAWGNTKEDVICSLSDADDRYDSAIKAGYEEAF